MKNLMLLIVLVLSVLSNSQAQSVEWGNELVDAMYIGYNNVLPLKYVEIEASKVKVEVSEGDLLMNSKGHYVWTHSTPGFQTITCKMGEKEIGTFRMKFIRIPDPIAETMPLNASPKTFKKLNLTLPNVNLNIPAYIQSFDIQITQNGDVSVLQNKGAELTENNRKTLKYVDEKASVIITKVIGRCPGDKAGRRLGDVVLQ